MHILIRVFASGTLLLASACASVPTGTPSSELVGTEWVLIGYQDATPGSDLEEVPLYKVTLLFGTSDRAEFKLDCNNGFSSWASASTAPGKGALRFGDIAATNMRCPEGEVGETVAADLAGVREYLIYDGRLSMSPVANGRFLVWDSVD